MKYNILTKEFLEQKYLKEELSSCKIAKIVGCSYKTILNYLKKYDISRRTLSEALRGEKGFWYGKHLSSETRKKMANAKWKGGRIKNGRGYIIVYSPDHPNKNARGYVREHRLVVEREIERYLRPGEKVHHIDGIKDNNDPTNLMALTSQSAHCKFHINPKLVKIEEIIFDGRKTKKEVRNEC